METGDTNEILGSYQFDASCLSIDMIPILCGYHISFCYFFVLGVVRGPHFCVKLEMCCT